MAPPLLLSRFLVFFFSLWYNGNSAKEKQAATSRKDKISL